MEPQESNFTEATQDKQKHKLLKPLLTILLGIILIAGTGLGVWYRQNGVNQKQKTDSDKKVVDCQKQTSDLRGQLASEKDKSKVAEQKVNTRVYTNNQQGFQLTFPERWGEFGTSEALLDDRVTKLISFGPKTRETFTGENFGFDRNYGSMFSIFIYSKEGWTKAQDQEGQKPAKFAETNTKVFAYSEGNGIYNPEGMTDQEAHNDVSIIIKSFKLL